MASVESSFCTIIIHYSQKAALWYKHMLQSFLGSPFSYIWISMWIFFRFSGFLPPQKTCQYVNWWLAPWSEWVVWMCECMVAYDGRCIQGVFLCCVQYLLLMLVCFCSVCIHVCMHVLVRWLYDTLFLSLSWPNNIIQGNHTSATARWGVGFDLEDSNTGLSHTLLFIFGA